MQMATLTVPEIVPSPTQDGQRLRKSIPSFWFLNPINAVVVGDASGEMVIGLGTEEKAVIWILGHRSESQRKKIRETYQQLYNESLIDRLHSELSGDFRKAIILWTYDPPERDARLAKEALKAKRKGIHDLQVLVEISCASSPNHLMAVRQAYCSLFDCSLEEDIVSSVPQPLRKILVGLVSSYRYDKEAINLEIAKSEAERLNEAINKKQLDHDHIVWVHSTRNFFQLRATFTCYRQLYGNSTEQDIKNCGNGNLESLLTVVVRCIEYPEKHFAKVVRDSIIGIGTDEDSLTRAITTRAEIDMLKVREEYANMYNSILDDGVTGDTLGD